MKVLKGIGKVALSIIIVLSILFLSFGLVMLLTDVILVENDYLFYEHGQITGMFLILLVFLPAVILSLILLEKFNLVSERQRKKNLRAVVFWQKLGAFKYIAILVYLVLFYICFTNITVVTGDQIILKNALNPKGEIYSYSQVEEINTGFGDKFISCAEYQEEGSFYYKIKLGGKEVVFSQPTPNDITHRFGKNSYLELEEFDAKLVNLGVSKKASDKGYEDCYYDDDIVQRFLRIINNK